MDFYVYNEDVELGHEKPGSEGRHIWNDLTTKTGAIRRAHTFGYETFRIYTFTNFYDDKTFKLVYRY